MAFDVLDEYEQGEVVRKWIRDNAVSMVVGVLLGLALIFGWQQWKAHQARSHVDAAAQYAAFNKAASANREADADKIASALREKYADSPYAVFAAMRQAEAASSKNDLAGAGKSLEWAAAHAGNKALKTLVDINLARLRLAQDKPDEALKLVNGLPQDTYPAILNELRGDVLTRLDKADAARTAYQTALGNLDPQSPQRGIVQMKLDDEAVATTPDQPAPAATTPAAKPATAAARTPEKQDS